MPFYKENKCTYMYVCVCIYIHITNDQPVKSSYIAPVPELGKVGNM